MDHNAKSLTNTVVAKMTCLRGATEVCRKGRIRNSQITEKLQTDPEGEFVAQRQVAKNAEAPHRSDWEAQTARKEKSGRSRTTTD